MTRKSQIGMPRAVARRIAARSARKEVAVVVPDKEGRPGRVYSLPKYLKMQDQPRQHQPWTHRKIKPAPPEPLGGIDGAVLMPLTRQNMYE